MSNVINTVSNTSIYIDDNCFEELEKLLRKFNLQNSLTGNIWNIPTGIIGQVNLRELQINIDPNVSYLTNLDYLRLISQSSPDEKDKGYLDLNETSQLEEYISEAFFEKLLDLVKKGFPRSYKVIDSTGRYFNGLVDISRSYKSYLLNDKNFVHSKTEQLEVNDFRAVIIRAAYEKICFINNKYKKPSITTSLNIIKKAFIKRVANNSYIQPKHNYNKLFTETYELAYIIINDLNKMNLGGKFSTSLLLNSNNIFEDFISNFLINNFPRERFVFQQEKLAANHNNKMVIAKPDILYLGPKKVIIDVKNKEFNKAVTSDNYHQMISYMNTFDIQTAVLVYPYYESSDEKLFLIKSDDKLKLYALSIDLKSRNFKPFINQLSSILQYG